MVYQHGYLLNDESHVKTMTHVIEQMGGFVQCFMQAIYGEEYMLNCVHCKKVAIVMGSERGGS